MTTFFRNKILFLFLIFINLLSFSTANSEEQSKLIKKIDGGEIDWNNRIVKVKGRGIAPETGSTSQRRLKARVAARSDAYRNIAKALGNVQITSKKNVSGISEGECETDLTADECDSKKSHQLIVKTQIEAVIKGARQIGEEKILDDNSVEVELYVPIFGNGSLAYALDLDKRLTKYADEIQTLEKEEKKDLNVIKTFYIANLGDFYNPNNKIAENNENITGLIIDATDFGIEPAVAPLLVHEESLKEKLKATQAPFLLSGATFDKAYKESKGGKVDVNPEKIIKYGLVEYSDDLEKAKNNISRIGKFPMIQRAGGAIGKPNRTNILFDNNTVIKILLANEKYKFLDNLAILIVI